MNKAFIVSTDKGEVKDFVGGFHFLRWRCARLTPKFQQKK